MKKKTNTEDIIRLRKDMPELYQGIKDKTISKTMIANNYNTTHTTVNNIFKEYENKLKQMKENESISQQTVDFTIDAKQVNKKISDFIAIKEIAKLQLNDYNTYRNCKQGSKIVTENKSDFIKKTMSLVYPNVTLLARIDVRELIR